MADTIASPLLKMLIRRSMSTSEKSWIPENLELTLAEIRNVVLAVENRTEEDEALRLCLTKVKDTAYDVDDVFDEMYYLTTNYKGRWFNFVSKFWFGLKIERKMKSMERRLAESERRLDELLSRRMKYEKAIPPAITDSSTSAEDSPVFHMAARETTFLLSEPEVFGREKDKETLMHQLGSVSDLDIIPIVGMGGLGKTTLAKLIYHDKYVHSQFERRCWVSVGEVFDLKMVGKAILGKVSSSPLLDLERMDMLVREELGGKKFLIVLDDLWNEDYATWLVLKRWFGVGTRGSAVIVTTRNTNVAGLVGTVRPYILKPLSDYDSWLLFKHEAFRYKNEEIRSSESKIGRRLVSKCKGLPLAIRTLAGLMRFRRKESDWLIMNDFDWNSSSEIGSPVLAALSLSYYHLPSHLKQCFAYCSIFPKGHKINKEQLIELWIAEGFVQSSVVNLEEIGNQYFMELVHRLFFVEIWRDDSGDILKCRMHDLIHDLAQSVSRVGCSIVGRARLQDVLVEDQVRYCSLFWDSNRQSAISEFLHRAKNLRTLLLFSSHNLENIIPGIFVLRRLRALDLSGSGIKELSKSVANLIHLRYLILSRTLVETLPESIGRLQRLNSLELVQCYNLRELPRSICELINLRRLDIQSCCLLSHMPPRMGRLKLLQKLPLFILSNIKSRGYSLISELKELDIRGTLEIKNLDYVGCPNDALSANLFQKKNLRCLVLSWNSSEIGSGPVFASDMIADEVLEKLQPPMELKVLHIENYNGISYPSWLTNPIHLENLENFSLTNCSWKDLPPLGRLPNLVYLSIKGMAKLQKINKEFYGGVGFPSLKQLELYDMPNLEEWSSFELKKNMGMIETEEPLSSSSHEPAFPCLQFLTIKGSTKLRELPLFPDLKSLALWSCNEELLVSLDRIKSLSSLVFSGFQNPSLLMTGPGGNSIRKITIYDSDDLLSRLDDGMKCFPSVEHLKILYCNRIISLPIGLKHLHSLRKLEIVGCKELKSVPAHIMQHLNSLEELIFDCCPNLDSFPESMHHLIPSLKKLAIRKCPGLKERFDGKDWSEIGRTPSLEKDIGESGSEEESFSDTGPEEEPFNMHLY